MQYCPKCRINIQGRKACCPLCHGKVKEEGEGEEVAVFPVLKTSGVSWMSFARVVTFLMIACEIVFVMIAFFTHFTYSWMMFAMLGALLVWADILVTRYVHSNLLKLISVESIFACLIVVLVDFITGFRGWSVCWVIPIALPVLSLITFMIAKIQRFRLTEYVMYLLLDFICAMLLLPFLIKGSFAFELLMEIAVTGYLILAAAVVIFGFKSFRAATSRRFKM